MSGVESLMASAEDTLSQLQLEGVREKTQKLKEQFIQQIVQSKWVSRQCCLGYQCEVFLKMSGVESLMASAEDTLSQLQLEGVREKTQKLKEQFIQQINEAASEFVDDSIGVMRSQVSGGNEFAKAFALDEIYRNHSFKNGGAEDESSRRVLPEKVFVVRPSVLTVLLEISHIRTLYYIASIIIVMLLTENIATDFLEDGKLDMNFELLYWNFSSYEDVIRLWMFLQIGAVVAYITFHFWASVMASMNSSLMDWFFLCSYVAGLSLLMYYPSVQIIALDLPPGSSSIIAAEQIRIVMKIHAFVRTNVSRTKAFWRSQRKVDPPSVAPSPVGPSPVGPPPVGPPQGSSSSSLQYASSPSEDGACPNFSRFLYFLFAPTLVYRDQYPRTREVRWDVVAHSFCQVAGVIVCHYLLFDQFIFPNLRDTGRRGAIEPRKVIAACLVNSIPSLLLFMSAWYGLLHCWMNAFAEMLRFGDRMFYTDWWTSMSFHRYYRTWNVVVHDWLYEYIYKDVYDLGIFSKKVIPALTVFLISSLVHEYVLCLILRFWFPVLLIMFLPFGSVMFFPKRLTNAFFLFSIILGFGVLFTMYSIEWFARRNCLSRETGIADWFIPYSLTCTKWNVTTKVIL
ncbi:unnamed protein product [Cyprideis torosa]|uniref:O-acyltransferase n=1 Tax=Cyprideis torosa TaxID=163714 RepID=A0A7R8ZSP8_9CRUS|nr:unnamed protein product [Cyprideis torosa]CAG0902238.1 unnamed protein product [Cyprideis torosa]